jgi:hypothetical protein
MFVVVLEATARQLARLWEIDGNDEEYQQAYNRHWAIREAINATPARTFPELKEKARAIEIELERDAADCEGQGSFLELTRSLIADLKAIQPAETRLQTAG